MRWLVVAVTTLLLLAARPGDVAAKDGGIGLEPSSGNGGSDVHIRADYWQPNTAVAIYVGAGATRDPVPSNFYGPVATTTSDQQGHWGVTVKVEDVAGFSVPSGPAFLFYKATSPDSTQSQAPNEAVADFALLAGGVRPSGAGEVSLTVIGQASSAWLDWQPSGSETFYISHVGPFTPPLRDYTLGRLDDGNWDIVVPSTIVPIAATGGDVVFVQATLCASPSITCDPRPGSLRVVRVKIQHGEIVPVTIHLGDPPADLAAPSTGYGSAAPSAGITGLFALLVLGVVAVVAGVSLYARRASP